MPLALTLAGLSVLSAWNLTRSEALDHARRAYKWGDLVPCLRDSLDHLDRRPWSRDAALLAAQCLSRLDYADDAEPYYRRAGRLTLDTQQIRAYGLVRGNHRQRAIQAYEEILKYWPNDVTALRRLAGVQMTQGNDPEVLRLAERAIRIPEGAVIGYSLAGVVHHHSKHPLESVIAFERVLRIDPELRVMPLPRRLFWGHLVYDLIAIGRTEDARRYVSQVLENEPDAYFLSALGQAYYLEGEHGAAEQCFRRAIERDPKDFVPHLQLGRIALQNKRDEAVTHLERAVELAPRQYDALYTLAIAYRLLGRTADADRLRSRIEQSREQLAVPPRPTKAPLPPYAL